MKLLLVGEYGALLQTLSVAVARRGFTTAAVGDRYALRDALKDPPPDAVIFDHTGRWELIELNPRGSGFHGPLLLLTDELSSAAAEELRALLVLRKPFRLASLYEQITLLTQTAT